MIWKIKRKLKNILFPKGNVTQKMNNRVLITKNIL